MMLRLVSSVAIALFLFQFLYATEAAVTGLEKNGDNDFQLDALPKFEGSLEAPKRIIEDKETYVDMKGPDSKKPWKIVRFFRWLKEKILWLPKKITKHIKKVVTGNKYI